MVIGGLRMKVQILAVGLAAATLVVAGASTAGSTVATAVVGAGPELGPFQLVPDTDGRLGVRQSYGAVLSGDGRFVAYGLRPADVPAQVYVWDRQELTTTLVTATPVGEPGNNNSWGVTDITPDGRYVLFTSRASDLVPGDSDGDLSDVFVRDLRTGTTHLVSVSSSGTQLGKSARAGSLTADGGVVTFATAAQAVPDDRNGAWDVYAHNLRTGRTTLVSRNSRGRPGNADSFGGSVSDDGIWVVFGSDSTNMPRIGGGTPDYEEQSFFLRNRTTGRTRLVSVRPDGRPFQRGATHGGGISGDGRVITFNASRTGSGTRGFVYERASGTTRRVLPGSGLDHSVHVDSLDGDQVAVYSTQDLTNEENSEWQTWDMYALRLSTGELTWITAHDPPVLMSDPHLSRNGNTLLISTWQPLTAEDTNGTKDFYVRDITW